MEQIKVNIINKSSFPLPEYKTEGSAGMDLCANISSEITLEPFDRKLIPTGLFIALPLGLEAQIRPRSGMALKKGLSVANSPGTIDSDYRGEIQVIIVNLSGTTQTIEPGERIAQMVIAAFKQISWNPTDSLDETSRGSGGFGSTGTK
jgi:dUTP pyrophosphatase